MTHEDYKQLLALKALSTLDQAEQNELQQHLLKCAECREELDAWHDTAGALAYAASPLEPSPGVRDRILESVRREARGGANVIDLRSGAQPRSSWFPRFAAIAASVTLVGLLIALAVLWQQNRTARSERARLSAQVEEARRRGERQSQMLELLSTRGTRTAELVGTKDAPAAHALLAYDPNSGRAFLLADGLPPTPPGKAYQLWFIVDNVPMPGGVFAIEPSGKTVSSDRVPTRALQTAVFAITQEAESGARTPTSPILLRSTS